MWGGAWDEAKELSRSKAALLLGCKPTELAITHNATEAFNLLAHGLALAPKDEVLVSSITHVGARKAWEHMAEARGFEVRSFEFPIGRAHEVTQEELVELHAREIRDQTKVLVLTDVDNIVGLRLPLGAVAKSARERGVEIIAVDGAQGANLVPVSLRELDIDVYATSTHKWMQTPKGMGLLYVRERVQDRIRPMITTWGQAEWGKDARRYEDYGTRNLSDVMTLAHAIDFQVGLDPEKVAARRNELRAYAKSRVDESSRLKWRSPKAGPLATGIYGIGAGDFDAMKVAKHLFEGHQVVVRGFVRDDIRCLRVSPNVIDSEADLDRFFSALEAVLG
jgi:selenocysteine lyase/cysteine desulfurase